MKKTLFLFLPLISFTLAFSGCIAPPRQEKTQLQIREFQTRSYDTADFKMVMKAVMNALQDQDFIIKQAELELGFITAQKELDVESAGESFLSGLLAALGGGRATYKKNSITEASINISEYGDQIRVRVNFQRKLIDNRGTVIKIEQVEDEKFYQEFFSKVDKSIFLGKEKV